MGGKTGTAETVPRDQGNYVVSFIGYVPADHPEVVIYVVVDRANQKEQDNSKLAMGLVRDIMTEVLPYMGIPMTEELTETEQQELADRQTATLDQGETTQDGNGENSDGDNADSTGDGSGDEAGNPDSMTPDTDGADGVDEGRQPDIQIDPETGYAIDPATGEFLDPETGKPIDPNSSFMSPAE